MRNQCSHAIINNGKRKKQRQHFPHGICCNRDMLYAETIANILGLAVELDHRKQGAGKLLVGEAERWATNHDIHAIRLNSGMSRKEAHKFYRNMEYVDEKDQKRFMKMILLS